MKYKSLKDIPIGTKIRIKNPQGAHWLNTMDIYTIKSINGIDMISLEESTGYWGCHLESFEIVDQRSLSELLDELDEKVAKYELSYGSSN